MTQKHPYYVKFVFVLLALVLIVFIMKQMKPVLVPLLVSGFFAILISPMAAWLEKLRVPKGLAVMMSLVSLILMVSLLVYFFYNQIIGFSSDLGLLEERAGMYVRQINAFTEKHFEGAVPISIDGIQSMVFSYLKDNASSLTQGIISTATSLTMAFIIPIYIFLFLYFRSFLVEFLLMAYGTQNQEKVRKIVTNVRKVVQNYISGMFIVICILAVLNSIALFSLGIKHALLFAVFAAFLNVIPFLGPFIGSVLPILYAFLTKDSLWYPFLVLMCFYVIQLFESNLFTPKIVGGKVSMNPLMTIIALFVGNFIWGLAGMILFIPGIAILKVIFDEVEGMQPYGFLLGDVKDRKPERANSKLREQIMKVRGRLMR